MHPKLLPKASQSLQPRIAAAGAGSHWDAAVQLLSEMWDRKVTPEALAAVWRGVLEFDAAADCLGQLLYRTARLFLKRAVRPVEDEAQHARRHNLPGNFTPSLLTLFDGPSLAFCQVKAAGGFRKMLLYP